MNFTFQILHWKTNKNKFGIGDWQLRIGNSRKNECGFTLIELIIVISITMILLSFVTINLASSSNKASLNSVIATLATDIKQQQIKAMVGDSIDSYGIYFGTTEYVLFKGSSYNPSANTNLPIEYGDTIALVSTSFPSNTVIFSRVSGEVSNSTSNNTIVVRSTGNNEAKTIELNKLGVIIRAE